MADDEDFLAAFAADQDDDADGQPADQQKPVKLSREERLKQTEESFRAQVDMWRPVCAEKQAALRIQDDFTTGDSLELKAAAEERYFMRDYDAAERIATAALEQGKSDMHAQELEELRALVEACRNKRPKSE